MKYKSIKQLIVELVLLAVLVGFIPELIVTGLSDVFGPCGFASEICTKIDQIGSKFMLSNSDTPFIRELFKNFEIEKISASRYLTGKYKYNSKIQELIIRNYK
jgi:hypothetical protein